MANTPLLGSFSDVGGSSLMFRNKIINGDMTIHQRQTVATTNGSYAVDRWFLLKGNGASESLNQNSDAPVGFKYSLRNTVITGDASIAAGEYSGIVQIIEGYNIVDLNFGTSSAKSITIQFWVKATVPGLYTGNVSNADSTRMCPFNFTINASNTWEFKTVTLPGCTDGVWNATNGFGLYLRFYSAIGSTFLGGTAGVWNSSLYYGSGTPVNGIASNGNIFAITGVQLEAGIAPTTFEYVPIQQQLAQCQRYYEKSYDLGVAPGTDTNIGQMYHLGSTDNNNNIGLDLRFKVNKRGVPNYFAAYQKSGPDGWVYARTGALGVVVTTGNIILTYLGSHGGLVFVNAGASFVPCSLNGHWVAAAEL